MNFQVLKKNEWKPSSMEKKKSILKNLKLMKTMEQIAGQP